MPYCRTVAYQQYVRLVVQVVYSILLEAVCSMCEERPCMAGVAVDRYMGSFMTSSHHLLLAGLSGLSVAALWTWGFHGSTSPGEQSSSRHLLPCWESSSTTLFSGRLDPHRVGWQVFQWRSTHRHSTCDGSAQRAQPQGNAWCVFVCLVACEDL